MEAAVCSPIHEAQRKDLQQRLVDNFHALLFHREVREKHTCAVVDSGFLMLEWMGCSTWKL